MKSSKLKISTFRKKIKWLKRRNKKISDTTLAWVKKYRFQVAKTKVLKNKIKVLRESAGSTQTNLNSLAQAISLA